MPTSLKNHVIVLGGMKAGTSALYAHFQRSSAFATTEIKETDFFKTPETASKGMEWYRRLYKGEGEITVEASPNYTKRHLFPDVASRIHKALPECKLIYIVRDPVERIRSHYLHNRFQGRETKAFSEAIRADSNYLNTTKYYYQLSEYLEQFGKENLLVIDYSLFINNPRDFANKIYAFVGLGSCSSDELFPKVHMTNEKKANTKLGKYGSELFSNSKLRAVIKAVVPTFLYRKKNINIEKPDISAMDLKYIESELHDDINNFLKAIPSSRDYTLDKWL